MQLSFTHSFKAPTKTNNILFSFQLAVETKFIRLTIDVMHEKFSIQLYVMDITIQLIIFHLFLSS